MTLHRTLAFLLAAGLVAGASGAHAQRQRAPADVQKAYDTFIGDFRKALKADDAAAVAQLTQFPFHFADKPDADFFRKTGYAKIFTPKVRACIAKAKGVYDLDGEKNHTYAVFCGETIFTFTRTAEGFRFTDIGPND